MTPQAAAQQRAEILEALARVDANIQRSLAQRRQRRELLAALDS